VAQVGNDDLDAVLDAFVQKDKHSKGKAKGLFWCGIYGLPLMLGSRMAVLIRVMPKDVGTGTRALGLVCK